MRFNEKFLYSPLHKSPINNVARMMDDINKDKLESASYQSGMPSFSNSKALLLVRNKIYHVNSPGWLVRVASGTLNTSEENGIILGNCSHMIDVYSDAGFNTCTKASSGTLTRMSRFMWSDAQAGKDSDENNNAGNLPTPRDDDYCVIVLPKKFGKAFTQSRRMTYVDYSSSSQGTANCQMIPVLPCNPSESTKQIGAMWAVYWHGGKIVGGDNCSSCDIGGTGFTNIEMKTETNGMYIMHCSSTDKDKVLFIPSLCAGAHDPLTEVREALSECNLNMIDRKLNTDGSAKERGSKSITKPSGYCACDLDTTDGAYSTLGVICTDATNKAIRMPLPTDKKKVAVGDDDTTIFSNSIIKVYGLTAPADDEWLEAFPNNNPPISGSDDKFYVYTFGTLEKVPIPDMIKNDKSVSDGAKEFSTITGSGKLAPFLELDKTTDLIDKN